ncbi:MAG: hypothetical protein IPN60_10330, partial [Saprospiraceae bacterium]|nr:hypothetical protein [Candidatus Opimibacter skivensis]
AVSGWQEISMWWIHATTGSVFVDFEFSLLVLVSRMTSLTSNMLINDRTYIPGGIQHFTLELPAQGQSHVIQVTDNGLNDCMASVSA